MNAVVKSVEGEFRRYKGLAEAALDQLPEETLSSPGPSNGNSIATICWHMSGNLKSRFTEFLSSDGEKPWRQREEEFATRIVSRDELMNMWNTGWDVLLQTLGTLADEDLSRTVKIRAQELTVCEALHRSLAHAAYHVGQIVYVAHAARGDAWNYLSIAPGQTAAYNADPKLEKPPSHDPHRGHPALER